MYKMIGQLHSQEKNLPLQTTPNDCSTFIDRYKPVMSSRAVAACLSNAARDFTGQAVGRILGLTTFSMLATLGDTPQRMASGVIGMAAGGRIAYLIASKQFGSETPMQLAGTGVATALGMISGAVIMALGNNTTIAGIATASILTAGVSWPGRSAPDQKAALSLDQKKVIAVASGVLTGFVISSAVIDKVGVQSAHLPSRNLGLLVESSVIEIFRSAFERLGPSVDRNVLTFEGRVAVAMLGMAPYVIATALLNGYISALLQPADDSSEFNDLIVPLVIGTLASAVKGFSNAVAVQQLHQRGRLVAKPDTECLREAQGPKLPVPGSVSDKACIRMLLSASRNAIYAELRDRGFSIAQAGALAQGIYACFAQCRDLIHDLARGDGWTEPTFHHRHLPLLSEDQVTGNEET